MKPKELIFNHRTFQRAPDGAIQITSNLNPATFWTPEEITAHKLDLTPASLNLQDLSIFLTQQIAKEVSTITQQAESL